MANLNDSDLNVSVERDEYEIHLKLKKMIKLDELESLLKNITDIVDQQISGDEIIDKAFTAENYQNLPIGSVVAASNRFSWLKTDDNNWESPGLRKRTDYSMSNTNPRKVLRRGWGNGRDDLW